MEIKQLMELQRYIEQTFAQYKDTEAYKNILIAIDKEISAWIPF
jgi:hypothetical protein